MREFTYRVAKDAIDFISIHRTIMADGDINRLNHTLDMLSSGNITEAEAGVVYAEVRSRTIASRA